MERVDRHYYADGTLKEEIHFDGSVEHGAWRTWHPNGVLAAEFWFDRGIYLNCVNRNWDEQGRLRGECVWKNGTLVEHRIFDATGALIDDAFVARQAQAAERRTRQRKQFARRRPLSPGDSKLGEEVLDQLLMTGTREALEWLTSGVEPNSRSIGMLTQEQSISLVHHLRSLGAQEVLVADIQPTPGSTWESSNCVLLELPSSEIKRKHLFLYEAMHAKDQGYEPDTDTRGKYLFLKFG